MPTMSTDRRGTSPQSLAALAMSRNDPLTKERQRLGLNLRKEIHAAIDAQCGDHAVNLVAEVVAIGMGTARQKARAPGPHEDSASYALVPEVAPSIRERLAALQWLIEYRNGRNLQAGEIGALAAGVAAGTMAGVAGAVDLSLLTEDELTIMEMILRKAEAQEPRTVEGQVTRPGPGP